MITRILQLFSIVLIQACLAGCSPQSIDPNPAQPGLDSLVTAAIENDGLSGAVLLLSKDEQIIHYRAYGFAQQYAYGGEPLETPVPMTTDHIFDLASLTKVFATTFGIMLLVDDGKIKLDDPVKTFLPAFSGPNKDSVTVRHLLTHTSGLYPWKPLYYHASNKRETYRYISDLELAYPVGKERYYSDLGFMLLGYLIEETSGQSLDAFLDERLYRKLGLENTGFNPEHVEPTRFAATSHGNPFEKRMVADDNFGYVCDEDPDTFTGWRERVLIGEVNDGNAFHAHNGIAGHAGLFSTTSDLQILLQLLLDKGRHAGTELIAEETVTEFLTPDFTGNGLGWAMTPAMLPVDELPEGAFGHTGFTGTFAVGVPERGMSIVLLTNRQHKGVEEDGRYMSVDGLRRAVVEWASGIVLPELEVLRKKQQ